MDQFDVVVIGAGPGGYVAAIRAAQLKLKVAVVEKEHLGGVCLNWGCIPTKALLRSAEVKHLMDHAKEFGLSAGKVEADLGAIVKRSRDVSGQLAGGIKHLLKKNGVTHIDGYGKLSGNNKVIVEKDGKTQTISAKNIILATGARARTLPGIEAGDHIWTAKQAMIPEKLPKSLIVIGSGAIGIEFASFYNTLGVKVTVVEMVDRILPAEDPEISKLALEAFSKQGIEFRLKTTLDKVETVTTGVKATLKGDKTETVEAEKLLLAIGIVGNTENIGLESTKIQLDRSQIKVDEYCRTAESNIFAIGDVVGAPWLAHKASHEGIMVAELIACHKVKPMKRENIPGCTYSMPQVASIGLSEEKAKAWAAEHKEELKIGKFPFLANGKALAMGEGNGLVKLIFAKKSGELLGAHMIGAEVTELINSLALCKTLEATEEDIMHTIFPHPTLSEMLHEAALSSEGRAIHF